LITVIFDRLFERFPNMRFASVENGSEFLPHLDEGAIWARATLAPSTGPSTGISVMDRGVKNDRCCGGVISRHRGPIARASRDLQSPVVSKSVPPGLSRPAISFTASCGSGMCSMTSRPTAAS